MKAKRETRPQGYGQYHIARCDPNDVWPKGGWSIYRITGDEIAKRIKTDMWGNVVERHSWPGYLGMVDSFDKVQAIIDADAAEVVVYVTYENAAA